MVICAVCQTRMTLRASGVMVFHYTIEISRPSEVWAADTYGCPLCGGIVVTGFGKEPIKNITQVRTNEEWDKFINEIRSSKALIWEWFDRKT